MLRFALGILILVALLRWLRSLFRFGGPSPQKNFQAGSGGPRVSPTRKDPTAGLTPYDIEDADYEDIRPDGG